MNPSKTLSALDILKALVTQLEAESDRLRALEKHHNRRIEELLEAYRDATDDADAIWEERKMLINQLKELNKEHDQLSTKITICNRKINR